MSNCPCDIKANMQFQRTEYDLNQVEKFNNQSHSIAPKRLNTQIISTNPYDRTPFDIEMLSIYDNKSNHSLVPDRKYPEQKSSINMFERTVYDIDMLNMFNQRPHSLVPNRYK